jgi:hypothetical protein
VTLPPELRRVNLNAAGVDIGAESHYVAVPEGRDPDGRDVRTFGAFTADLAALADWLTRCGIETVAMESTAVYWIPLFELSRSAASRSRWSAAPVDRGESLKLVWEWLSAFPSGRTKKAGREDHRLLRSSRPAPNTSWIARTRTSALSVQVAAGKDG